MRLSINLATALFSDCRFLRKSNWTCFVLQEVKNYVFLMTVVTHSQAVRFMEFFTMTVVLVVVMMQQQWLQRLVHLLLTDLCYLEDFYYFLMRAYVLWDDLERLDWCLRDWVFLLCIEKVLLVADLHSRLIWIGRSASTCWSVPEYPFHNQLFENIFERLL